MTICSRCGHETAHDARFCSGCGVALAGEEKAGETRKVVTVLFTDLVGFTNLGERLDPETVRRVMSRYFDAMKATIERHGGTVEKFIGDAIMAVFGVPTLHEDDALRAVRTAVEMRAALADLNEEIERRHGIRIATRTGVNTGQVVVGDASTRQKLATGDAVNVAARLEQAAGPHEIFLGEETRRLVDDTVKVEELEPLAVKGKAAPVSVWRVVELLPDAPTFTGPIAAPFVGRRHELEAVRSAFDRTVRTSSCTLATVIGPPGIGKSRLARELGATLGHEPRVVVGRCLPYGESVTYAPLAEIVHQAVGPEPERGVAELVAGDDHAAAISGRIAAAVGAGDHIGSPEEIAWAFRKLFESLARERPLVVVLDDVHWAEATLLDLLEYVVAFSSGAAILLLCLARPDLLDTRPAWAAPRPNGTLLSLSPLSDGETHTLIERLLLTRALSDATRARIVEAAEGNPLFVEQILAMHAEDPDVDVMVPPTIQALLAARIDRLQPDEPAVLVRASVEGRLFHRGALAELLPPAARSGCGAQLMNLVRKEFVSPAQALFPGDDAFRFNHVLIRDAAYESMPKRLRADLHERYASWLEHRAEGHVAEFEESLGHHLERSYRLRAELGPIDEDGKGLAAKAGSVLATAGGRAAARGDIGAAARLLERAVDLLSVDPTARLKVLPDYGAALNDGADLPAAERVLEDAIEQAGRVGDVHTEMRARVQLGWTLINLGADDWAGRARGNAERAIEVFQRLNDEGELAGAWVLLGVVENLTGNVEAALAAYLCAHEHARTVGDDWREVYIRSELSAAMMDSRTPVEDVIGFLEEQAAWAREKGFPYLEADAAVSASFAYPMLGRFEEARELLAKAKSISGELGARYNVAQGCWAGAKLELLDGDVRAAERELREGVQIHQETGATRWWALMSLQLANVVLAQGREDEAEQLMEQAGAAGATENIRFQEVWRRTRAKLLAARGETGEAVRLAREAVEIVAATGSLNGRADALVDLATVLRADGRETEADAALAEAVTLYEEKGNLIGAERARSSISQASVSSPG
jgi:class 3 adenylate cyclase/tetratricopeptide (TPR) repeat protein